MSAATRRRVDEVAHDWIDDALRGRINLGRGLAICTEPYRQQEAKNAFDLRRDVVMTPSPEALAKLERDMPRKTPQKTPPSLHSV